VKRSNG